MSLDFNTRYSNLDDWKRGLVKYFGNPITYITIPTRDEIIAKTLRGGYVGKYFTAKSLGLISFAERDTLKSLNESSDINFNNSDFMSGTMLGYEGIGYSGEEDPVDITKDQITHRQKVDESESLNTDQYEDVHKALPDNSQYFTNEAGWLKSLKAQMPAVIIVDDKINGDLISGEKQAMLAGRIIGYWSEKEGLGYIFSLPTLWIPTSNLENEQIKKVLDESQKDMIAFSGSGGIYVSF